MTYRVIYGLPTSFLAFSPVTFLLAVYWLCHRLYLAVSHLQVYTCLVPSAERTSPAPLLASLVSLILQDSIQSSPWLRGLLPLAKSSWGPFLQFLQCPLHIFSLRSLALLLWFTLFTSLNQSSVRTGITSFCSVHTLIPEWKPWYSQGLKKWCE